MNNASADGIVQKGLLAANATLAREFAAHVVYFRFPLMQGVDDFVRDYVEGMQNQADPNPIKRLCVLIETNGGQIEVVERIYSVLRKHYEEVIFVVPSFAYSAGTVLVLSGDEIYMDYYSVLGPIDPQLEGDDGILVPGIGYLSKFNELVKEINEDPTGGDATRAQLHYLVRRFDPAKLFFIEQARDHAIQLLKEWLPKHKFKDWKKTNGSGTAVTDEMKTKRADAIATILGNPERWHSHGRGIGIRELEGDEIKLVIKNFGDLPLNQPIRDYYNLATDYFQKVRAEYVIHGPRGIRRLE